MESIIKVGERIKHLREQRNYSQEYLASKLNISQRAYSKVETGETKLSVDNLLKIAETLETSINNILGVDGNNVFNNTFTITAGDGMVIHKTASDKIGELYEKIISAKDDEIKRLVQQNETLLRSLEEKTKGK